jgi:hypothetical protein
MNITTIAAGSDRNTRMRRDRRPYDRFPFEWDEVSTLLLRACTPAALQRDKTKKKKKKRNNRLLQYENNIIIFSSSSGDNIIVSIVILYGNAYSCRLVDRAHESPVYTTVNIRVM